MSSHLVIPNAEAAIPGRILLADDKVKFGPNGRVLVAVKLAVPDQC